MSSELVAPELSLSFGRLLAAVGPKPVAVVGHARPDGDCIGSQVALARGLRALGKTAVCVNANAVPRRLLFAARGESFVTPAELEDLDYVAVYVDCADRERVGAELMGRFPVVIGNIDHHLSNQGYAEHNCVSAHAAATCEILAGLFLDRAIEIDALTAQALYTGILTDTGQFRFASTTHRTFHLAAELVARGADPVEAGYELYEREPAGKFQLLQRFLASLEMHAEGRICIGTLPHGVFAETGTSHEDTEGLVDYARAIDGVDIGGLIEEREGGAKASLRAKEAIYRVDQVAARFGGGGHACAAGLSVEEVSADGFRPRLVAALMERLAAVDLSKES